MAEIFSLYSCQNYREAIKGRLKDLQSKRSASQKSGLTLKKLADRVSVQYTYLSRCLASDRHHLSEDHVYSIGRHLDFLPEEIDFLLLLRNLETAQDSHRRARIFARLEELRQSRLAGTQSREFKPEDLRSEAAYLFSPLAIVVHVALFIKDYQKNPRLLCPMLGISAEKLKELLSILDKSDYVVLDDHDPFVVAEVKTKHPHFGREHPLMRAHQSTLKALQQSRLLQTSEPEKDSFLATFTMDDEGFQTVREAFKDFVAQVQKISSHSKHKHVYQLSFDFLKWL